MPIDNKSQKAAAGNANGTSSTGAAPDRESESRTQDEHSGRGTQDLPSSGGYGKDTGAQGNMNEDELTTAGGREGQFSDRNRGSEDQWSPGASGGPSDE